MEPDVVLYGFPDSLCSQKVRLALAEKGAACEDRFVDIELRRRPSFVAARLSEAPPNLKARRDLLRSALART